MHNRNSKTYRIVFVGVMAAIVCVVTFFRFPVLGSKVHFANAMCLLAGMLFGPVSGGLAAGLGSGLYDVLFGGYDLIQGAITFISKFAMAWVCAKIVYSGSSKADNHVKNIIGSVIGALTYVALYMLKTLVYQHWVYGNTMEATFIAMGTKLPASLINAVFAMIVAPILCAAIRPILKRAGMLDSTAEK